MIEAKAYTEAYYIIKKLPNELIEKIPLKVLEAIKQNMDKNYDFKVENDNFENVELMDDTEKILSVIYTDYLASDEERKIILNKERIIKAKKEK